MEKNERSVKLNVSEIVRKIREISLSPKTETKKCFPYVENYLNSPNKSFFRKNIISTDHYNHVDTLKHLDPHYSLKEIFAKKKLKIESPKVKLEKEQKFEEEKKRSHPSIPDRKIVISPNIFIQSTRKRIENLSAIRKNLDKFIENTKTSKSMTPNKVIIWRADTAKSITRKVYKNNSLTKKLVFNSDRLKVNKLKY